MALSILLDTSTWICYLRPRGWDDLKIEVQHVLTAEQVYTGCHLVLALVRIYVPCRQPPILRTVETREHVSMMNSITLDSRLYTLMRMEALNGLNHVIFLPRTRWALDFISAVGILWRGCAVRGGGKSAHRAVQPVLTARMWAAGAHLPGYQRLWSPV